MHRWAVAATVLAVVAALRGLPAEAATGVLQRPLAANAVRGDYAGPVARQEPVTLYIALQGRHQSEIDAIIAAQNDPHSPAYRHYLTPAQYARYFGANPQDYAQAVALLRASGFTIDESVANRKDLIVHAPAVAVESLFATPLDRRVERGRVFFTNRYEPEMPAALHGAAVVGLDDYGQLHPDARQGRRPQAIAGGYTGWGPADIRNVYDVPSPGPSSDGAGVTIGEATVGLAKQSDFAAFEAQFGLHAKLISAQATPKTGADTDESTLDVEWIAGIAPGATILQVSPENNKFAQFTILYSYFANKRSDVHIVSTSWGACEQYMTAQEVSADESLFQQATMEGQWWLGDAGDYGSDDCKNGKDVSVNYPASSPYVVSVGGTEVTPASTGGGNYTGWASEVTWDTPGSFAGAGGGGVSTLFKKPAYQRALTPHDGKRDVPDVALMSDWNDPNGAYLYVYNGRWLHQWGGTSFATPEWAALLALVQQREGATPIASPLVRLYALAASANYASLFHDITSGCNGLNGVPGFCAKTGYDRATGLGSFIGGALEAAYEDAGRAPLMQGARPER